uniref:FBD domain-containing protein n=1 Tax=Aegilops tauschii subsp. strangulata TaxID=200361 RepID=A0A453N1K0_AEGTS
LLLSFDRLKGLLGGRRFEKKGGESNLGFSRRRRLVTSGLAGAIRRGEFVFTRDLEHCPAFSKLKTLVLNEYWCEAPDLDPLACILKNSPVLEKLTLQLFSEGPNHEVEMEGSYCCMERPSAISEHLNIVEVKCNVVDKRILKILRFLCAFNIRKLTNGTLHILRIVKLASICQKETN